MSDLKWPHQPVPRQVGSLVDNQVMAWVMRQGDHGDAPSERGRATSLAQRAMVAQAERKQKAADRLGFRYWGDAITSELVRLMHRDDGEAAYLNEGIGNAPTILPKHGARGAPRMHR